MLQKFIVTSLAVIGCYFTVPLYIVGLSSPAMVIEGFEISWKIFAAIAVFFMSWGAEY